MMTNISKPRTLPWSNREEWIRRREANRQRMEWFKTLRQTRDSSVMVDKRRLNQWFKASYETFPKTVVDCYKQDDTGQPVLIVYICNKETLYVPFYIGDSLIYCTDI